MVFVFVIILLTALAAIIIHIVLEAGRVDEQDIIKSNSMLLDEEIRNEAVKQAEIVGDEETKSKILDRTYDGPWPEKRQDGGYLSIYKDMRILKIAGINYRTGIDKYIGRVDCALVPEPQNEFDPDAIKIVASDRHHLGYIPTDMTDFVRDMADFKFPIRCVAYIRKEEDEEDGHKFFVGFVYIKRRY